MSFKVGDTVRVAVHTRVFRRQMYREKGQVVDVITKEPPYLSSAQVAFVFGKGERHLWFLESELELIKEAGE